MAIFNVNESSLNSYLNENRHDVKRALKMTSDSLKKSGLVDYDEKTLKKGYKMGVGIKKNIAKNSSTDAIKKAAKIITDQRRNDRAVEERNKPLNATPNQLAARKYLNQQMAKDGSGKVYGAELKKRGIDPKTGEKLEEAAKLREAAEYILSVLDESEKKIDNKELNNAFKNAVKYKAKELSNKGKVVDINSLPDNDDNYIKDKI